MLSVKRGTVALPTVVGNFSVSGLGFQPKFILFRCCEVTAAQIGTEQLGAQMSVGFAEATNSSCLSTNILNGLPTSDAQRAWSFGVNNSTNASIVRGITSGLTTSYAARLVSLDSDGFTLAIPTNQAPATAHILEYMAFGGDAISNTYAGQTTIASIVAGTDIAVTGVGFQPKLLMLLYNVSTSDGLSTLAHGGLPMGFAISATERGYAAGYTRDGVATMSTSSFGNDERMIGALSGNSAIEAVLDLVSMDADGFTYKVVDPPAVANRRFSFLAIAGSFEADIRAVLAPTSPGQTVESGLGFQPKGLVQISHGSTALAAGTLSTSANMHGIQGFCDETESQSVGLVTDMDGAADSRSRRYQYEDAFLRIFNADDSTLLNRAVAALDSDGYTLDHQTVSPAARELIVLSIGEVGGPAQQNITGLGDIASSAAVGSPTVSPGVREISGLGAIPSSAAVGTPTVQASNEISGLGGIASSAAVGTPTVATSYTIESLGGIPSSAVVGTPMLEPGPVTLAGLGGIASSAAVGTPEITVGAPPGLEISGLGGIASSAVVGTPTIVAGEAPQQDLTGLGGIASGAGVGTPTISYQAPALELSQLGDIPSGAAVGSPTLTTSYTLSGLGGIPSSAQVGSSALEPSYALTGLGGIASSTTVGTPALEPGVVTISGLGGIASSATVGIPGISSFIIFRRGVLPTGGVPARGGVLTGGAARGHATGGVVSTNKTGGAARFHKTGGDPDTFKTGGVVL